MNKLQLTTAKRLGLEFELENDLFYNVRCVNPDHNDKHPSAFVMFNSDGSGVYGCHGCGVDISIRELAKELKLKTKSKDKTTKAALPPKREKSIEDFMPVSEEIFNALERFIEEKGITQKTLKALKAVVTNDGYLTFKYGISKKEWVARLIIDNPDMLRYKNSSTKNKGLMGEEFIKQFTELYLLESVTDWLMMYQLGFRNIVCCFGDTLTEKQAYLLRGKTVFILFHNDFAGYMGIHHDKKGAVYRLRKFKAVPIPLELYEDPNVDQTIKQDVCFLCNHNAEDFKNWLALKSNRYTTNSQSYYRKNYRIGQTLRYYKSNIPALRFAVGLHLITGKSGVGKTTVSMDCLRSFSKQGAKTLYMNGELPHNQIIARLESADSQYSFAQIEEDPSIVEEEVRTKTDKLLANINITGLLTIDEIYHSAKYYDIIFIDYIQKLKKGRLDERVAIDMHLEYLTELVNEHNKVVICVSRMPVSSYDKTSGHLYSGSGQLEYSCQQGILLSVTDRMDVLSMTLDKATRQEKTTTLFRLDHGHQKVLPNMPGRANQLGKKLYD